MYPCLAVLGSQRRPAFPIRLVGGWGQNPDLMGFGVGANERHGLWGGQSAADFRPPRAAEQGSAVLAHNGLPGRLSVLKMRVGPPGEGPTEREGPRQRPADLATG